MQGREYLELARKIVRGGQERHWRGASGRAYYAILLEGWEALSRWGFVPPPRQIIHTFVRLRFDFPADADLKKIGKTLEVLGKLRNQADYYLASSPMFASPVRANQAIQEAAASLALLDAIDADPVRRAAAVAAIRAAFP